MSNNYFERDDIYVDDDNLDTDYQALTQLHTQFEKIAKPYVVNSVKEQTSKVTANEWLNGTQALMEDLLREVSPKADSLKEDQIKSVKNEMVELILNDFEDDFPIDVRRICNEVSRSVVNYWVDGIDSITDDKPILLDAYLSPSDHGIENDIVETVQIDYGIDREHIRYIMKLFGEQMGTEHNLVNLPLELKLEPICIMSYNNYPIFAGYYAKRADTETEEEKNATAAYNQYKESALVKNIWLADVLGNDFAENQNLTDLLIPEQYSKKYDELFHRVSDDLNIDHVKSILEYVADQIANNSYQGIELEDNIKVYKDDSGWTVTREDRPSIMGKIKSSLFLDRVFNRAVSRCYS